MITRWSTKVLERSDFVEPTLRYRQREKVGDILKSEGMTVKAFKRLEVGEGIEKKQENFAEEVAAAQAAATK